MTDPATSWDSICISTPKICKLAQTRPALMNLTETLKRCFSFSKPQSESKQSDKKPCFIVGKRFAETSNLNFEIKYKYLPRNRNLPDKGNKLLLIKSLRPENQTFLSADDFSISFYLPRSNVQGHRSDKFCEYWNSRKMLSNSLSLKSLSVLEVGFFYLNLQLLA